MPTEILSGTGAATAIGNLGGSFGSQVFGILTDRTAA